MLCRTLKISRRDFRRARDSIVHNASRLVGIYSDTLLFLSIVKSKKKSENN